MEGEGEGHHLVQQEGVEEGLRVLRELEEEGAGHQQELEEEGVGQLAQELVEVELAATLAG